MEIQPIQQVTAAPAAAQVATTSEVPTDQAKSAPAGFAEVLVDVVNSANQDQLHADQLLADFAAGKSQDLQAVVMSTAKADLSFRFFLEMRNKLTESYQELSRMQF